MLVDDARSRVQSTPARGLFASQPSTQQKAEAAQPTIDSIRFPADDDAERQERVRNELVKGLGGMVTSGQATQIRLAANAGQKECLVLRLRKAGRQHNNAFTHRSMCNLEPDHDCLYLGHIDPPETDADGKIKKYTVFYRPNTT